jgi:signal transduction histidine kinase
LHKALEFQPDCILINTSASRPPIEVIKDCNPNLVNVECFGGEINQVFVNILANAIGAIEECSSQKTLDENKANPDRIRICTEVSNYNTAIIRIYDRGQGISEEVRQRIFDPFFTAKPIGKGTGIGLSISWHIVAEKHGGSLQCTAAPGKGRSLRSNCQCQQQVIKMAASGCKVAGC